MEILKFPHPSLLKPCNPVTVFDIELKVLLGAMWDTMQANNGLGLAANQVGLPWAMFVMSYKNQAIYLVNPKILHKGAAGSNIREGCLSAPGEYVVISDRSQWVQVEYQNEKGEKTKTVFTDLHSVCVQHEIEHLDGKSHLQSKSIPKNKRVELAKKWGLK